MDRWALLFRRSVSVLWVSEISEGFDNFGDCLSMCKTALTDMFLQLSRLETAIRHRISNYSSFRSSSDFRFHVSAAYVAIEMSALPSLNLRCLLISR